MKYYLDCLILPIALLSASLIASISACDHPAADSPAPRDGDVYGPGCEYGPLIYNDDYINSPAECVMKHVLCLDAHVGTCDDNPEGCLSSWQHCGEHYGACLKIAVD